MIRAIKQEIAVRSYDFLFFCMAALGGWVFGVLLLTVIHYVFREESGWFGLGTIMGMIAILILLFGCGVVQSMGILDLALSMSQRRRDYYWANLLVTALEGITALAVLAVLGILEKWIVTGIARLPEYEMWKLSLLWRWSVPVLIAADALISLAGLFMHRFGKKASVPITILFVSSCWMPMLLENSIDASTGSALSGIGKMVNALLAWMTEGKALCILVVVTLAAIILGRVLVENEAVKG